MKEQEEKLRQKIHNLLIKQKLGVLSTHNQGQPWGSLVAFAVTSDLKHIVFATPSGSRKFANIMDDVRVSRLLDNSVNTKSDFTKAIGVTVLGRARKLRKSPSSKLLNAYLAKHDNLRGFVLSRDCALMCIDVESYHVVEKFEQLSRLVV